MPPVLIGFIQCRRMFSSLKGLKDLLGHTALYVLLIFNLNVSSNKTMCSPYARNRASQACLLEASHGLTEGS